MLVESTGMRNLLNTLVTRSPQPDASDEERAALEPPKSYEFSVNPIPALIIFLLGMMMGGHSQPTMVATMVHKQWGNLLLGASLARMLTYVTMYLKPPKSVHPSRPPTELLAAFGLISGGIIFMYSVRFDNHSVFLLIKKLTGNRLPIPSRAFFTTTWRP